VKTGDKRTGITIVTAVTCTVVSSHGRAGELASGHDRGNAAIRARLPCYRPAALAIAPRPLAIALRPVIHCGVAPGPAAVHDEKMPRQPAGQPVRRMPH
jgi:hypothetical protein